MNRLGSDTASTERRAAITAILVAVGIGVADVVATASTPVPLRYALGTRRLSALLGVLDATDVGTAVFVADVLLFYLGTAIVIAAYLRLTRRTLGYLDVHRPNGREAGYIVGGSLLVVAFNIAVNVVASALDLPAEPHPLYDLLAADPSIVVTLLVLVWFVNAPFEEILYRNVIQKHLYGSIPRWAAVLVASVVFAATHNIYFGGDPVATAVSLTAVFLAGLVFGGAYARTENLLVPITIHGVTNSYGIVLFALTAMGG